MLNSLSLSTKEKIATLEDANRPLEIHWNVKAKFGLNARESDSKYKHHVSNLEEIYCKEREGPPPPPHMLVTTPGTELYGCHGLLSTLPGIEEKKKLREESWVPNHQKFAYLKDPNMVDKDYTPGQGLGRGQGQHTPSQRSRSQSPLKISSSDSNLALLASSTAATAAGAGRSKRYGVLHAAGTSSPTACGAMSEGMHLDNKDNKNRMHNRAFGSSGGSVDAMRMSVHLHNDTDLTKAASEMDAAAAADDYSPRRPHITKRTCNPDLSAEEMVMLGVYRLDEKQAEIYGNFVAMLAGFDAHDSRNIVEDALHDAQNEDLLQYYGGTEVPAD